MDGVAVRDSIMVYLRRLLQTGVQMCRVCLFLFHATGPTLISETERRWEDGWGASLVDDTVPAGLTSQWEDLDTTNPPDWSKPPQIESVVHWDDTGAKETWEFVTAGRSPVNNPDLYLEKNIDWNSRIPSDLLAFEDDTCRYGNAPPPRSGSPVLLGLETLVQSFGGLPTTEKW